MATVHQALVATLTRERGDARVKQEIDDLRGKAVVSVDIALVRQLEQGSPQP
jgi:hypothetical protein